MPLVKIVCPHAGCLSSLSSDVAVMPGRYESMCPQGHRLWVMKSFRGVFSALPRAYGETSAAGPGGAKRE